ncbi:MAG: hypothetical protein GKR88_05830 [Flavobacteriaceae bacterium]|nr:MAG: hypothetical protein GKR88_05830 [Flavobacteriaceae bacterium]
MTPKTHLKIQLKLENQQTITGLQNAGYQNIFDIAGTSRIAFKQSVDFLSAEEAKVLYEKAEQRVHNLQALFRAYQLRNDPAIANNPKLAVNPILKSFNDALARSLGNNAGFEDFFPERSEDGYADVSSIQSLFSSGRYLTSLYYIAQTLHPASHKLNINNRRPDLQNLILSNEQMNKEVTSLDILLEVLQGSMGDLQETYYPVNLPYDDSLTQIRSVLEAQDMNLPVVWDILYDHEKEAFDACDIVSANRLGPNNYGREYLNLMPENYDFIITEQDSGYLDDLKALYNEPNVNNFTDFQDAVSPVDTFCAKTGITFNKLIDLTGQKNYRASGYGLYISRFLAYNKPNLSNAVNIEEYGSKYIGISDVRRLYVKEDTDTEPNELKVFTGTEGEETYRRVQKLLRLVNSMSMAYHELDWVIQSLNEGLLGYSSDLPVLDATIMEALGEFVRLRDRYAITADQFAAFTGRVSIYHEAEKESFFQQLFSNADQSLILSVGEKLIFTDTSAKQLNKNAILCSALQVTNDELLRIATFCYDKDPYVQLTEQEAAKLYRMGFIPSMLGLSYSEAEYLWRMMSPEDNSILDTIKDPTDSQIFHIIRDTEYILSWLDRNKIPIVQLPFYITSDYSAVATPKMFNFLSNLFHSIPVATETLDAEGLNEQALYKGIAAGYSTLNLKANQVPFIINWIENSNDIFTLADFWKNIYTLFQSGDATFDDLNTDTNSVLIQQCQILSQYTLITQKWRLTEQDLHLFNASSDQLLSARNAVGTFPAPSLPFLLMISRLKEWQQRLVVSSDEGMQYFTMANKADLEEPSEVETLQSYLAEIHGWATYLTTSVSTDLFPDTQVPFAFEEVFTLETYVRLALQLETDGTTLGSLNQMATDSSVDTGTVAEHLIAAHQSDQVKSTVKERRRDAYVAYYIANCVPDAYKDQIQTPDDLYEYLLLDTQITDAVTSASIAEAIASLQLYIHRCVEGYDPEVDQTAMSTLYAPNKFLYNWNDYNKRYATWAGKERLVYYAGSYIDPTLRYGKTELFQQLEQTLNQGKLNENQVLQAVQKYLVDYDVLARLTTISGHKNGDTVFFVGRSEEAPFQYYWRSMNTTVVDDTGKTTAGSLTEWKKIGASIDETAEYITPFWYHGRLHVSWRSQEEQRKDDTDITVYFFNIWYLDEEGKWQSYRKMDNLISDSLKIVEQQRKDTEVSGSMEEKFHKRFHRGLAMITVDDSDQLVLCDKAGLGFELNDEFKVTQMRPKPVKIVGEESLWSQAPIQYDSFKFYQEAQNAKVSQCIVDGCLFNSLVLSSGGITKVETKKDGYGILFSLQDSEASYAFIGDFIEEYEGSKYFLNWYGSGKYREQYMNGNLSATYSGYLQGNFTLYSDTNYSQPQNVNLTAPKLPPSILALGISSLFNYDTQTDLTDDFGEDIFNCSYGIYIWELFFHLPFLIANRFATEQRFEEAEAWYKYIFSSTGYRDEDGNLQTDGNGNPRYWNVIPLQEDTSWNSEIPETTDPDVIAMNDPMQYKLAIFQHTIQLLIDRGDAAYRQLERDTLVEAKMFYIQASQLMGPYPEIRINNSWSNPTLSEEAGNITEPSSATDLTLVVSFQASLSEQYGHFLPPYNEDLLIYWDTLELRLYNLRHGLTIDGQPMSLPLYATPVSPKDLQVRQVSGDGFGSSTGGTGLLSEYRFSILIEKARTAVSALMQFGSSLLTAIEKQDNEALTLLMQTQQNAITKQQIEIQQNNLNAIGYSIDNTTEAKNGAENRKTHYTNLVNNWISTGEQAALGLRSTAAALNIASSISESIAGGADTVPNVYGFAVGGSKYGAIPRSIAKGMQLTAMATEQSAVITDITENYRRRREDWMLQKDIAENEIAQLDAQLENLEEQRLMAQKQLTLAETEAANAQALYEFQTTKFTGQELYNWIVGRLSSLYYQLYDATLPICIMCKEALIKETSTDKATSAFTTPAWNDLYQGLLAGESLQLELQKLDRLWLEESKRGLEATKTVSVDQICRSNDTTLVAEIQKLINGEELTPIEGLELALSTDENPIFTATITLNLLSLGSSYNTTGNRVIKNVAISLPALLGPYQDVEATLMDNNGNFVTLSHGQNDSGMWVLNYNDERFLPFEGVDPTAENSTLGFNVFNVGEDQAQEALFKSISDVVFHIDYNIFI